MEKKRKRNRPAGSTQVERCRKVRGNVFFPPWQWAQESAGWPALLRRGPPGRKFPHVRRTLRETCTQPPPPPLPPASKVRRRERLRGVCRLCSIPDVPGRVGTLLRPVGRKSAALQPLVSGCFVFFLSLFDKEMQISHRPDRLLAVFFLPRVSVISRGNRSEPDGGSSDGRGQDEAVEPLRARRSDSSFSTLEQEPVLTFAPEISPRASAWLQ